MTLTNLWVQEDSGFGLDDNEVLFFFSTAERAMKHCRSSGCILH